MASLYPLSGCVTSCGETGTRFKWRNSEMKTSRTRICHSVIRKYHIHSIIYIHIMEVTKTYVTLFCFDTVMVPI